MNFPTICVLAVILCIVGLIIYGMVKDKKQGKTSCSHGCQNCALHGQCHRMDRA